MAASNAGTSSGREGLRIDGRVAAITGAGGGMGREHALLLGRRGAHVLVNDLQQETADAVVEEIRSNGGSAAAVVGSIAESSVAEAIVKAAIDEKGRIDIVINNAGIEIKNDFVDFTPEDLSRVLGVHVHGSWNLSQLAWPHMQKQKYGKILLVSSTSLFGMAQNAAYVTAKGAIFGLGQSLAQDGKDHGISVNVLGPTAYTPMAVQMLEPRQKEYAAKNFPASAISAVVAWLVHEDCKTTGEFITAYGRSTGRIFLAETRGSHCPDGDYEPETVRDNFEGACDTKDFIIPNTVFEGLQTLMRFRAEGTATK